MRDHFQKSMLIILDGWGIGKNGPENAIYKANPRFYSALCDAYPSATLKTFGENVGLPLGQMGNSEVGHLNLGAGRVVYQELSRINRMIRDKSFFDLDGFRKILSYCQKNNKPLHLMGLVSDGGVHSHIDHLLGLVEILDQEGITSYIHAFTDGRDTDPGSGKSFIKMLMSRLESSDKTHLASICGRYYAMDRDKRWERTAVAYELLIHGKGEKYEDPAEAIQASYDRGITDEFIRPISLCEKKIEEGDAILCFNFRTDRLRQLTEVLTQTGQPDHGMTPMGLQYWTMTML